MTFLNILIAIIAFNFLIFFHELFHYLAGRMMGIEAKELSVGFGKSLLTIQKRKLYVFPKNGEINNKEMSFHLKIIPLGGYVSFYSEEESEDSLTNYHPLKRMFMTAAGPLGNLLLGFVLLLLLNITQYQIAPVNQIVDVKSGSYAEEIGLQKGDYIYSVNQFVRSDETSTKEIRESLKDEEICLEIKRDEKYDILCGNENEKHEMLGVTMGVSPLQLSTTALSSYGTLIANYVESFANIILNINITQLSGPIGVVDTVQQTVPVFTDFLSILIILNVALAVVNIMFPLTITDGGRIIIDLICLVRNKKKISTKYLDMISIAIVLIIFISTTFFDIKRLFLF